MLRFVIFGIIYGNVSVVVAYCSIVTCGSACGVGRVVVVSNCINVDAGVVVYLVVDRVYDDTGNVVDVYVDVDCACTILYVVVCVVGARRCCCCCWRWLCY